jgi:hypothetical protein
VNVLLSAVEAIAIIPIEKVEYLASDLAGRYTGNLADPVRGSRQASARSTVNCAPLIRHQRRRHVDFCRTAAALCRH